MNIRPFEPEDVTEFLRLSKRFHSESGLRNLQFSPGKLMGTLAKENLFLEIAWEGDWAVGMCMGWVEDTFFGPDKVAHQHLFYIVPEQRGSMLAPRMMRRFEAWAYVQGAKEIWVSQASGIQRERTKSFFEIMGFTIMGCIGRKVIA